MVALLEINGAFARQSVQEIGENRSLTYLRDYVVDERAFCSPYNDCAQVIE